MGYSMRTDRYRYTEWRDLKTKAVTARELYDLQTDPRSNSNAAAIPENEMLVKNLAQLMKAGYRAARP